MRLRKKPWISEALREYSHFVYRQANEDFQGRWQEIFGGQAPLHVELGTGKGQFISGMAQVYRDVHFIGIEAQQDVLYYAAQKVAAAELDNVRLLVFDINHVLQIFAKEEVNRFYINFCDPWPKSRHDKRRLTHRRFLAMYSQLLAPGGEIHFKTDNRDLFDFSLEEFAGQGWQLDKVTYDLHNSVYAAGNVMTEYEKKFSASGLIHRLEARPPGSPASPK